MNGAKGRRTARTGAIAFGLCGLRHTPPLREPRHACCGGKGAARACPSSVRSFRETALSIVHFHRWRDAGGPMEGAAASCDGAAPDRARSRPAHSRFVDCPLAPRNMMKAVRAAAPRPAPSGRAGIAPAKTVESRRFSVCRLSTFHDQARCSCAGRRPAPTRRFTQGTRAFVRSAEVPVRERGFACACIALPIRLFVARSTFGPDDWAASLWAPP